MLVVIINKNRPSMIIKVTLRIHNHSSQKFKLKNKLKNK